MSANSGSWLCDDGVLIVPPAYWASQNGHTLCLRFLIEAGCNLEQADR